MILKGIVGTTTIIATTLLLLSGTNTAKATSPDPAAETLSLEQAITLAEANSPLLKAAANDIDAATAGITKSNSAYFPRLDAHLHYTALHPVSQMSFPGDPVPIKFMPNDNYDARITASAVLLDFGQRKLRVEQANTNLTTATTKQELTKRELDWQSIQLFYGILFLRAHITVTDKEIAALQTALDYSKKRYRAGTATPFDLFATETRLADARSRRLGLRHELTRYELSLRQLTALPDTNPLNLNGSFAIPSLSNNNQESLTTRALGNRSELLLMKEAETGATQEEQLALKKGMPVLTASLSAGYLNGYQPDIYEMRSNTSVSLDLAIPIFSGFGIRAEQARQRSMRQAASQRRIDTEQQIKTEVAATIDARNTALEQIGATETQLRQAELAARHARSRYENGMATTLDLLNTETALSQAEFARLSAAHACVMQTYRLRLATGSPLLP